jgi:hypothetical protein
LIEGGAERVGRPVGPRACPLGREALHARATGRAHGPYRNLDDLGYRLISSYDRPSRPIRRITTRCSSESRAMARSRSRSSRCLSWPVGRVSDGSVSVIGTTAPSRTAWRTWLTCWLCRMVKSQARRSEPFLPQTHFNKPANQLSPACAAFPNKAAAVSRLYLVADGVRPYPAACSSTTLSAVSSPVEARPFLHDRAPQLQ